jgi:hypothetical protein
VGVDEDVLAVGFVEDHAVLLTICFSFIIVDDILANNYNSIHRIL